MKMTTVRPRPARWDWVAVAVVCVAVLAAAASAAPAAAPYEREAAELTKAALAGTDFSKLEYLCDTFGPRFSYPPPVPSFLFVCFSLTQYKK
jgi:hypothetical protein